MYDSEENVLGWKAAESINQYEGIDEKVIYGKNWDATGKCASMLIREPRQLYENNLRLWIDYPNKLGEQLKKAFSAL